MGLDKRLIEFDGRPLWRQQIEILQLLNPTELVISGPTDGPWNGNEFKIIPDPVEDAGPLAGITIVLSESQIPLVLTLAVDMPRMTTTYLQSLLNKCTSECGVVPCLNNHFEPLAAIYPRNCAELARTHLTNDKVSLQEFAGKCVESGRLNTVPVGREQEVLFQNLNTLKDLKTIEGSVKLKTPP